MSNPSAGPAQKPGFTIWFTGLSGAGKSTLSRTLSEILRSRGRNVEILYGDEVRENLSKGLGFSREDRDTNIRRIGYVCHLLSRNGVLAISAAISPWSDSWPMCDSSTTPGQRKAVLSVLALLFSGGQSAPAPKK